MGGPSRCAGTVSSPPIAAGWPTAVLTDVLRAAPRQWTAGVADQAPGPGQSQQGRHRLVQWDPLARRCTNLRAATGQGVRGDRAPWPTCVRGAAPMLTEE